MKNLHYYVLQPRAQPFLHSTIVYDISETRSFPPPRENPPAPTDGDTKQEKREREEAKEREEGTEDIKS